MYHNSYSKCAVSKLCEYGLFHAVTFTLASAQKLRNVTVCSFCYCM